MPRRKVLRGVPHLNLPSLLKCLELLFEAGLGLDRKCFGLTQIGTGCFIAEAPIPTSLPVALRWPVSLCSQVAAFRASDGSRDSTAAASFCRLGHLDFLPALLFRLPSDSVWDLSPLHCLTGGPFVPAYSPIYSEARRSLLHMLI